MKHLSLPSPATSRIPTLRCLLCLGLLLLLVPLAAEAQRKKVGVVLSGGGAKGVAHIGVLQVLEKAGIPVDVIVGTSMGSIVGGLYAIGYSADQLDSLVRVQDRMFLLSDKVNRYDLPFGEKEQDGKYLLSLPFDRGKKRPSGFISGQNVYNLFSDLTVGYHDSLDFLQLPIPFACVAADLFHREEIVMTSGNLVQAMRASMAIPGVFTPVRTDNRVLVDGGILNNFPTDVARRLGAEIVIGVDVQADLMKEDKLASVSGVIPQIINLLCMNKHEENVQLADLVIRPDVKGYSAASFSARSIDSLLARGKVAALQQWSGIMQVKELIGKPERPGREMPQAPRPDKIPIRNIIILRPFPARGGMGAPENADRGKQRDHLARHPSRDSHPVRHESVRGRELPPAGDRPPRPGAHPAIQPHEHAERRLPLRHGGHGGPLVQHDLKQPGPARLATRPDRTLEQEPLRETGIFPGKHLPARLQPRLPLPLQ